jgi:peroxiredoxin
MDINHDLLLALLVTITAAWLVSFVMILRMAKWIGSRDEERRRHSSDVADLTVDAAAPDFRAESLSGSSVSLADFAGKRVAFVFVSPNCSMCRDEIPRLVRLAPMAAKYGGVELVLVSDAGRSPTRDWLDTIAARRKLSITLPVLISEAAKSRLVEEYNPKGNTPFFVLLDERGIVKSTSLLAASEWQSLRRQWETAVGVASWRNV